MENRSIREFIYVDVPKLYSLYSQVFEGITDRIIDERINQLITGDTQNSFLAQASAISKGVEESHHIESSILHDHMYNRLESQLGSSLINASEMSNEELVNSISKSPIIKVTGRSEIEDYERLSVFLTHLILWGKPLHMLIY